MTMMRTLVRRSRPAAVAFLSVAVAAALAACGVAEPAATPTVAPGETPAPATPTPVAADATPDIPTTSAGTLTLAIGDIFFPLGTPRFNHPQSPHLKASFMEAPFLITRAGDGSLQVEPYLALAWDLDPNLEHVDLTIRRGVQFHGGWGEVTVDDWVFSFNDANAGVTPESVNDMAGDLAALFLEAHAIDDDTVRLPFNTFQSNWLERYLSSFWEGHVIYSKAVFDEHGPEGMRELSIGTGALEVVRYVENEIIHMEAFQDHWQAPAYASEVRVLEVPENASRRAMLETGEADITHTAVQDRPDLFDRGFVAAPEGFFSQTVIAFGGNWWEDTNIMTGEPLERTLDLSKPWIGDPNDPDRMESARLVRQALAHAIDRQGLNQGILLGLGMEGYLPGIHVNEPEFRDEWKWDFDMDRASELLAQAGYADGFTIDWWVGPGEPEIQEAIGGIWAADLGVNVNFDRTVYATTFRPTIINRSVNKVWGCGSDGAGFPVVWPKGFLVSSISDGGFMCGTEHRRFGEIFLEMSGATDPQQLIDLAAEFFDEMHYQAVQVGVVDSPSVPLYNPERVLEWEMLPEGKGVMGGVNNLGRVRVAD